MVKSMFAGVAGLRAHQSKMDIIGNNIANVNTWGYKAASMSFKDTMYQTTSSSSSGSTQTGGYGGTNAGQVGYGVTTGSISYDFATGGMAPSASGLDCMIDGSGFFIVGPMINGGSLALGEEDALKSSGLYLSRVGKFQVDGNGYLTDDSGNYVYGFERNGDLTSSDYNTTALVPLKIPTKAELATLGNKGAADKVADAKKKLEEARALYNSLDAELGNARAAYIAASNKYTAAYAAAGIEAYQTALDTAKTDMNEAYKAWDKDKDNQSLRDDYLDKRKVYDTANSELIIAQANVRKASPLTAAKVTELNDAVTDYTNKYTDYILSDSSTDPDYETKKADYTAAKKKLDELQTEISKIEDKSPEGLRDSAKLAVDSASAKLDAAKITVQNAEKTLETAQGSATTTEVGNASADDTIASLTNYKIQTDGTVVGTTEDGGITVAIGKIALAGVQNTGGLEKDSGYYYTMGANSGNISVYEGGGTEGRILGNYLEQAKVDLAMEMTEMITTQRGFQANSKIITVTDQMLDELVNMKR
ncbi:flagellar hook-basal body protein [Clostridium sp. ASBs410]|nr:flagellar hook-basal body protein [Clostridium sp. ASBs410]